MVLLVEIGAAVVLGYSLATLRHKKKEDQKRGIYRHWWEY